MPSPSSHADMIPKNIHYAWFGNKEPNAKIQQCMASWARFLPEYQIVLWNESNTPMDVPYVQWTYARGLYTQVADYVRLYALSTQGGIYLDTDIQVLKKLDPLLKDEVFVGFEGRRWVNNAVIGATANHPFIQRCLEMTLDSFDRHKPLLRSPAVCTAVLKEMGLRRYGMQVVSGVHIYPQEYFYPYPWWAEFHPIRVKPTTYTIHHWQRSGYDMKKFPIKLKLRAALYQFGSQAQAQLARLKF